jgi:hypothetical protein
MGAVVRLIALKDSGLAEGPANPEASFHETRQRVLETFERAYLESLLALHNLTPTGRRK